MKASPAIALGEVPSLFIGEGALGCNRSADIEGVKQLNDEVMQPLPNQKQVSGGVDLCVGITLAKTFVKGVNFSQSSLLIFRIMRYISNW